MTNCIIVEDEPLAADVLKDYVAQLPHLNLICVCSDAMFATKALQDNVVDLMFLDIHLPGLKGMEFLDSLVNPPQVILTTAYQQYAIEGYEKNVVDYLLKPIEFKRFLKAVNKVSNPPHVNSILKNSIAIQTDKKKVVIKLADIQYIESQKEYIYIKTLADSYTTRYALTTIELELNPSLFLRVHRSFIINLAHLKSFNAIEIYLPSKRVPIGGNYKEQVTKRLAEFF